jgi:3-hydroxyisobutyrate dehydrogenase-like beta-hydroxyacid dehydrogenase
MRVAVFGLGEAGGAIAGDLASVAARRCDVHAYDPRSVSTPPEVTRHHDPVSAVAACDAVFAFTSSDDAPGALEQAFASIPSTALYADFSTAAAGVKQRLAQRCGAVGLAFADVAMMSPVPGKGMYTPMLVSGTGATKFVNQCEPLGMVVEHAGDVAGTAATRKLLRSVVIKGFAALVIESMHAANAAGLGAETWENLVQQFTAADETFLRRIVEGTGTHSLRRLHEMEATAELLGELNVDPLMTQSTVESLRRIESGWALPELPKPSYEPTTDSQTSRR